MPKDSLIFQLSAFRESLKGLVGEAVMIKGQVMGSNDPHYDSEVVANITIAYRALEDAAMRFGKAIQAADGGVSPLGGPNTPGVTDK